MYIPGLASGGPAASQPAPPATNLGVTGHTKSAAESILEMSKKLDHIYTMLDSATGEPAASQHRPTSDGTCNIFEKKKKKKKSIWVS